MDAYFKLGIAALLPAIVAALFYLAEKKTVFGKLNANARQIVYGIVFGILAVIGTEWGIPINGAQVNCRDAAALTAGLLFGGPAGIIAGVIGGVERWIAVAWGVGTFTRVACSISTVIAGVYAALLRKFMFENKKPGWLIAFAVGVVMEVFHLTMVFLTNMTTPEKAMEVVAACSVPMIVANGASVLLAAVLVTLLSRRREAGKTKIRHQTRISQTIQRWLLVTLILAFLATSYFVFELQDRIAVSQEEQLLSIALDETESDIRDASDANLLSLARRIAVEITAGEKTLAEIAAEYDVTDVNVIGSDGVITDSAYAGYIGYAMASGEQSAAFLCLLDEATEFVQEYGPTSMDASVSRKYAGIKTEGGFIQVGFNSEQFQKDIDNDIIGITKNRHVGKTGYILIIDERFNVISAPEGLSLDPVSEDLSDVDLPKTDETVSAVVGGERCVLRYRMVEGYYIVSVLPEKEALQTRNIALYVNAFMEILVFAVMFGLIYMLIKHVVVNQIKSINDSLAKITGGDLNETVNVRSNAEFSSLSDDINMTVDTLKRYIDEASARIDKELEFAKNIQKSALPGVFPAFPKRKDFDIFASMNPAKEVGGDFYDFYMTNTDTLHFLIADVSGKGIPAAMFMMRAKTELKSLTETELPIDTVFTNGNRALCEGNDAGMFVTAWQGGIDLTTGLVRYANAGHNPPLVRHADGKFEYLRSRAGFVLAGMDSVRYKQQELQLSPGDVVYLYTDGVTEATNAKNELYGEERLLTAINSREFETMEELCRFVKADVDAFVGEAPQFDDITMVALRFIGTKPAPTIRLEEAKLDDIPAVTAFVEEELEKLDCPMKTVIQINVAIDEIFSNIVRYGYPDTSGPVSISVVEKTDPHMVCIRFCDEGVPYNPLTKEDPDVTLSAEDRSIGGLGIYMVKKTMDDLKYRYENGQNIFTIFKKLD